MRLGASCPVVAAPGVCLQNNLAPSAVSVSLRHAPTEGVAEDSEDNWTEVAEAAVPLGANTTKVCVTECCLALDHLAVAGLPCFTLCVHGVLFALGLQVSCHNLVATALRIELHGRRSDNKLNVVALGNVVVTKPNPAALYTPTLGVLGDLQVRKGTCC